MPDFRPGQVHYAVATKAVLHGAPCSEDGFTGVAIKQIAAPAGTGLGSTLITTVAIGEAFIIQIKGRVYVANTGTGSPYVKGDTLYLTLATYALTKTGPQVAGTTHKFGRVTEVAGTRGVGTGQMRVDLDAKDTFV
jgi:hypothetical protein